MDEFSLIRRYFSTLTSAREGVRLGIGDDCALLEVPPGHELVVTTDTLVAGRHFPERTTPEDIGWKALAVNLSDLAAMGAEPRWFSLALTLPEASESWLAGFAKGLKELAEAQHVALVGGDTTRGPLSITISAMGLVPKGLAILRSGARAGDVICVTGTLGDAALGLKRLHELNGARGPVDPLTKAGTDDLKLLARLNRPLPRVNTGLIVRRIAHAAIDLSDGLAGDLAHLLVASGMGADVHLDKLPASPEFDRLAPPGNRHALQLAGGDDYELCICLPEQKYEEASEKSGVPLAAIGRITPGSGIRYLDGKGRARALDLTGYRHFG